MRAYFPIIAILAAVLTAQPIEQIAFVSMLNGNEDIFIINEDGTGLSNLPKTPQTIGRPNGAPTARKLPSYPTGRETRKYS